MLSQGDMFATSAMVSKIIEILLEVGQSAWLDGEKKFCPKILEFINLMEDRGDIPEEEDQKEDFQNARLAMVFANWSDESALKEAFNDLPS